MRHFKYRNTNKNQNRALKEQYKSLTKDEQRTLRQEKRWRKFSRVVFLIIFTSAIICGTFLLKSIPQPNSELWEILVTAGKVIASIVYFFLSFVATVVLTIPLWNKVESFHIPSMKKEIFSKACGHLRDYYELQEPYIITKCFDASDKNFRNHDVCIFVVRDELRLTTDLVRGFLHGKRDLGCYVFKRDEITISKQQNGNHLVAELKAGDTVFLLGYRAKGYIEKNFLTSS